VQHCNTLQQAVAIVVDDSCMLATDSDVFCEGSEGELQVALVATEDKTL